MSDTPPDDLLDTQIDASFAAQNKQDQFNIGTETTGAEQTKMIDDASNDTWTQSLARSVRSTMPTTGVYEWANRNFMDADPNFHISDHWTDLTKGVPLEDQHQFNSVTSLKQGQLLRDQILTEAQDNKVLSLSGTKGLVTSTLTGLLDPISLAGTLMTGGTYLGTKTLAAATKAGLSPTTTRLLVGGTAGAEANTISQSANVLARPTEDWTTIPTAGLQGLVFGSALHGLTGAEVQANKAASAARQDFTESVLGSETGRTDYTSNVQSKPIFGDDSIGAASTKPSTFSPETVSEGVSRMRTEAQQFIAENELGTKAEDSFPNTPVGRSAKKMYDAVSKTALASDWDNLWNSNSMIAKATAYKLFESPSGILRNNKSGALLDVMYQSEIAHPVNTNYGSHFDTWARDRYPNQSPMISRNDRVATEGFNNELMQEMQYRYHDGVSSPDVHPAVKQMADYIDQGSAKAVNILKGAAGENPVSGSENLKPESGWFRQLWRGDKISAMIRENKVPREKIESTLSDSYQKLYPGWNREMSDTYAKAVVRRSLSKERGIDTSVARMLDTDGRDYMEQFLKDSGISQEKIDSLIDGLRNTGEKDKINPLKERRDVDLRDQIPGTPYKLAHLVDNDVLRVWTSYSRQAAGAAAMARHGIQKLDRRDIINAIKSEEEANGGRTLSDNALDGMFSYFDGGAFSGGLNPWMRRALQVTNLSLLNGLGLTQMAELGVQIGAMGWQSFIKTAPEEIQNMLNGKMHPALNELRGLMASIDGEHNIHMDWMALDHMKGDPGHFSELGKFLDGVLVKGARLQGYISGFYKVNQLQQRTAVRSMLYRLAEHFEGRNPLNEARLNDLGLDSKTLKRIGNYFKDGTVEFSPNGDVLKLNFDKWKPADVYDMAAALNRHVNQVVQKSMRGESSEWMNRDVGALLAHLKQFTFLSVQKQLLRNARITDTASSMSLIYSLMTAGAVYTAQQAIAGKNDNLTPDRVMRGTIALSNMTGWLPQFSDPVMSMLGMDSLRFSPYNSQGVSGDVIGAPPALSTINRIAHIPAAAVRTVTGNAKNQDIYALQAAPIIGNAYGLSYMFNKMKDDAPPSDKK